MSNLSREELSFIGRHFPLECPLNNSQLHLSVILNRELLVLPYESENQSFIRIK